MTDYTYTITLELDGDEPVGPEYEIVWSKEIIEALSDLWYESDITGRFDDWFWWTLQNNWESIADEAFVHDDCKMDAIGMREMLFDCLMVDLLPHGDPSGPDYDRLYDILWETCPKPEVVK